MGMGSIPGRSMKEGAWKKGSRSAAFDARAKIHWKILVWTGGMESSVIHGGEQGMMYLSPRA